MLSTKEYFDAAENHRLIFNEAKADVYLAARAYRRQMTRLYAQMPGQEEAVAPLSAEQVRRFYDAEAIEAARATWPERRAAVLGHL